MERAANTSSRNEQIAALHGVQGMRREQLMVVAGVNREQLTRECMGCGDRSSPGRARFQGVQGMWREQQTLTSSGSEQRAAHQGVQGMWREQQTW